MRLGVVPPGAKKIPGHKLRRQASDASQAVDILHGLRKEIGSDGERAVRLSLNKAIRECEHLRFELIEAAIVEERGEE